MKILFLYPEYTYPRKSPPIGVASLAAFALQEGHDARIIDFNVTGKEGALWRETLGEYAPDMIGISFMTNQYAQAIELIKKCKIYAPQSFLVAGGPHASAVPEELMDEAPELDGVVCGEGEIPLIKLLDSLSESGKKDLSHVPGLYYRISGSTDVYSNGPNTEYMDFTEPPWPAWHLLDLEKYKVVSAGGDSSKPTFALLSSRGCPAKCTFCDSNTVFGRKFRGRTAEDMLSEIMYLNKIYGMEQFDFVDDLITTDKKRIMEFCELLINSPIKFNWMANARLNTLDEEMLSNMQKAGCVRIDVGVESADPKVRKLMKKGVTNEQIVKIHKYCKEIGLYVGTFLMVGNFGETMESVRQTAKLMKGLTSDPSIAIACPYPGTELYRIAKEKGYLLTTDWKKYGTAPTFMNGYEPVMRTDTMSPEEIVEAYYYLQSFFAVDKFRSRFGKHFYFNPRFIKEYLIQSKQYGGFFRKGRMGLKLVKSLLKGKLLS